MLSLKQTLLLNGVSSGITGAGLIFFSSELAKLFGVSATQAFTFTGIFLVLFAAWVLSAAVSKRPNARTIRLITIVDICWVLASALLLVADGHLLTMIGNLLVGGVAIWVGLMAFLQNRGLVSLRGERAGSAGDKALPSASGKTVSSLRPNGL